MKPTIRYTADPPAVELQFCNAPVEYELAGDVVADVNRLGNWIRGLELLGSGARFSLQQALASLPLVSSAASVRQPLTSVAATYDEDANAAFLYLPYASPSSIESDLESNPLLLKSSYSIEDEQAEFGLTAAKSLVFIRFKVPETESMEAFLRLMIGQSEPPNPNRAGAPASE